MPKKDQKFWKSIRKINKKTTRSSLNNSIKDGAAYSVMNGFGKNYLSTFAVALQSTNLQLGLLNSLPMLVSSIAQLVGARISDYTGKRMKLILQTVLWQGLSWIPLFFLPFFFKSIGPWFLILFVSLNLMLEALSTPAWNSLLGDIVKENERGKFFGKRNKIIGVVAFVSVITGGVILSFFENINVWIGFFILFTIAGLSRAASYYYMSRIYEPNYKIKVKKKYKLTQFLDCLKEKNFGNFVKFNTYLKFAVNIASPFFVPFLLLTVGFNYLQLTAILSASTITSFLVMLYWGKNADLFGNRKIMIICGFLIPMAPMLWVLSNNFFYIFCVQCLSGFAWSGYNLASSNFVYDTVAPEKRARGFAFYNFTWGVSMFIASMVGVTLTYILPKAGINSLIGSNYEIIFLISALLRLIIMLVYVRSFKEVRKVKSAETHVLFLKLVAVRPLSGIVVNTMGSLDFTYNQVKKHYRKPYDFTSEQLKKHYLKPYEFTSKQLQKPYWFVKNNVNFDELLKKK